MRPNIFDYATSELSQDAFLAWYCRWADESMKDDVELHKSAREFLMKYIAMQQPDYNEEIHKVVVETQHEHIDVFLMINDNLSVIIEDKVHAYKHDNQLIRYSDAISGQKVKLYIKTGDESLSHKMDIETNDGYVVIYRAELLDALEKCKSKNEIFVSFVQRLRGWENATHLYHTTDVWDAAHVVGFYKDMERVLPNSNWGHVSNPNKGNWVLNWSWLQLPDCRIYLEFSFPGWCAAMHVPFMGYFKLLVKITVNNEPRFIKEQKSLRHELLHKHSKAFIAHSNGLVHRPHVLRPGRFMTIAEIGFSHFAKDSMSINVQRIAELLHPFEEAIRTYAESMNINAELCQK